MGFFRVFLGTGVLCLVCWVGIVAGQVGHPTAMSQWISDAYAKKMRIAKGISGRKVVIVAGSNALFGIDSGMLSEAFGLPVLNDAVNAGIELPCTLHMAKKVIGEGDIVLMPLEYPMYSYQGEPGVQMIDFLLAREPECFWELTWKERFYILWHVSIKRIQEGYSGYRDTPVTSGLYGAHHIDAHGDQTRTQTAYRTEQMYQEVLTHDRHPETYGTKFDAHALGWKYLEKFVSWCQARHADVVFMPSTLMRHAQYREDPKERWFYTHIAQEVRKHGWAYVGDPYAYMYEKRWYLNTNYHLVEQGRKRRTQQMIADLNQSGYLLRADGHKKEHQ